MAIEFVCPVCSHPLSVDFQEAGREVKCPACSQNVSVPLSSAPVASPQEMNKTIFCPKCGQKNPENNFKCTQCGFPLHSPQQPQYIVQDSTMGGLIPYKNIHALLAYYLGIFSFIPCIGFPLAIAALILGLKGLKNAKLHPEVKGKIHAWVGIIAGGFFTAIHTLLIVIMLIGVIMGRWRG